MLRIIPYREAGSLLKARSSRLSEAEKVVAPILEGVRRGGDAALLKYASKLDALPSKARSVAVPASELQAGYRSLSTPFQRALRQATRNVRDFARMQLPKACLIR